MTGLPKIECSYKERQLSLTPHSWLCRSSTRIYGLLVNGLWLLIPFSIYGSWRYWVRCIVTPDGRLCEPKVLIFGLCNAPSTYQRLIDRALVYIDDTSVYPKTFSDHLVHLRLVLEAFQRAKLTLKPPKCSCAYSQLEFLGHLVSNDGISVNPKKVAAITEIPTPKTVKEVQSFVSLCSYYRKFIKDFAKSARPLTLLSRSDVPFCFRLTQRLRWN